MKRYIQPKASELFSVTENPLMDFAVGGSGNRIQGAKERNDERFEEEEEKSEGFRITKSLW
ncbi:MAG: hypothetical protein II061_02665 [Bacteroidaceae bacterium]|jgi:hypothetical protein|nr:hypothetical protein [Bacteroidaceae bacterium]